MVQNLIDEFGQVQAVYFESSWDEEWVLYGEAPAEEQISDEVGRKISQLQINLHTASPEEKDKIRAAIAQLRQTPETKPGSGSKRQGRSAAQSGYGIPAQWQAARRSEAVIRDLEAAVNTDLPPSSRTA